RVTPNREAAARKGTHMGRTPIGFKREYPAWDGHGKRPCGVLVPRERQPQETVAGAGDIREMFARYATGAWSTRGLAGDLNRRGITGAKGEPWSTQTVCAVLRNVAYCGDVAYNQRPCGHYLAAAPGSAFVAEGQHQKVVDRDVFE